MNGVEALSVVVAVCAAVVVVVVVVRSGVEVVDLATNRLHMIAITNCTYMH